jgi:hypothetical protein
MLQDLKTISSSSEKTTNSESVSNPASKNSPNLIKPDFSPIISKENKFIPKTIGAYKTKKKFELESPLKTPDMNFFIPMEVIGRDLFGVKKNEVSGKKLNFGEFEQKVFSEKNHDINDFCKNFKMKEYEYEFNKNFIEEKKGLEKEIINDKICDNRMENNFIIIKTLVQNKFDAIYQVKEKDTKKIYCIKKISEKTNKNNFKILQTTLEDIQKENKDWILPKTFCMKYIDFWIENKNYNMIKEDTNYLNKNMYILTEYYSKGDLIDYLEQLEKNNFVFTPDFYWDIIFEMIIGLLYIHNKGYIHFDIKPTNYLVDDEGFIILNDFGLSHKEKELSYLDDIIEGDSKYISKELFECLDSISLKKIKNKTDIFSLGLTILEIIAKIEIPSNGQLWKDLRNSGSDILSNKIFVNSNISDIEDFLKLIKKMIKPVNERPSLMELINETSELNKRYEFLKRKSYKKIEQFKIYI